MGVHVPLPSVQADADHRTVTLGELRELVRLADAQCLPDGLVVRGKAIPFKMNDLGKEGGSCMNSLALDWEP
jgi:hypothetical protein